MIPVVESFHQPGGTLCGPLMTSCLVHIVLQKTASIGGFCAKSFLAVVGWNNDVWP